MSQPSEPLSILRPTKKLSQLIAQSWLNGERLTINSQFLIDNDILSQPEADFYTIVVDESPTGEPPYKGYTNAVTQEFYIPYPQRPAGVEDKDLIDWVNNSPTDSHPWTPPPQTQVPFPGHHTASIPPKPEFQ